MYRSCYPQKIAGNGTPKFNIQKLLLQNLIEEGFTVAEMSLAHFRTMFSFKLPGNIRKPSVLIFSRGIEREHWPEVG